MSYRMLVLVLVIALLSAGGTAQSMGTPPSAEVAVGDTAPAISAQAWVGGAAPDLSGKPVLLEFWGTWCAPCVASMPHVQDLWTRYRERGLVVVALSYEAPETMLGFLEKHGYTMPVASDPERASVAAFGVTSWPTTFVIDREGRVIYRGFPSGCEPFVQQALGIERSATRLLTLYLAGTDGAREALEQLVAVAPSDFALDSWALGEGGTPAVRAPKDPGATLSDWAGKGATRREAALAELAAVSGPYDLKAWAAAELAERYPIPDEEFLALLEAERYADAIAAIVARNPSAKALGKVKADDGLRDWCHERVAQNREHARVAVLLGEYVYGPLKEPEEIPFPPGVGVRFSEDKATGAKSFDGVVLPGGEELLKVDFPGCMHAFLARTVAMDLIDKRKPPKDVAKAAAKLHDELLDSLKKQYGAKRDG